MLTLDQEERNLLAIVGVVGKTIASKEWKEYYDALLSFESQPGMSAYASQDDWNKERNERASRLAEAAIKLKEVVSENLHEETF